MSPPVFTPKPGDLSFPQRLCLLTLPCLGISAGILVIYIAVTCEGSYGLAQDSTGHFLCEPRRSSGGGGGEAEVGDMVANIAKVAVILVVLLTVTFTLTIAAWHVMVTRCTGASLEQPWSTDRDAENPACIQQVLIMPQEKYEENSG